jgi:hypothetical protein
MPHGVIAALTAAMPLIEKLLPLIEKFIDMLSSNSTKYNNDEITTDEFLKNANESLKDLQKEAATNDVVGDEFTFPDDINSASECKEVADTLQKLIDDKKVTDPKMVAKYEGVIASFRKAEADFTAQGKIIDFDSKASTTGDFPFGSLGASV